MVTDPSAVRIQRVLPHQSIMGVSTPNPVAMQRFADTITRMGLTVDELILFAQSPVTGPNYEFGDKRVRYSASKKRWFVRCVVEAHFLPAVDLGS